MAVLDFVRDAGEKLFNVGAKSIGVSAAQQSPAADNQEIDAANAKAGDAILNCIRSQNLKATGLTVTYDGAMHTAAVYVRSTQRA